MKKKVIGIWIVTFLVAGLCMYTPIRSEDRESRPQKTFPEILQPSIFTIDETPEYLDFIIDVGSYTIGAERIKFADDMTVALDGKPLVPAITKTFIIPESKLIDHIEILSDIKTNIDFVPVIHKSIPKDGSEQDIGETQHSITTIFPEKPFKVSESPPMKSYPYKLCYFTLYPAQYDPQINKTVIHKSVKARIYLKPSTEQPKYRGESKAVKDAQEIYGNLDPSLWVRGMRSSKSKVIGLYVTSSPLGAMMTPVCIHWVGDHVEYRYRIVVSAEKTSTNAKDEGTGACEVSWSEAQEILTKGMKGQSYVKKVTERTEAINLVLNEWQKSPGIIVASEELANTLVPIASYLDWPLFVDTLLDISVQEIADTLGATTLICAGCTPSFSGEIITVSSQREANLLLTIIHQQTGFKMKNPEEEKLKGVLNPPRSLSAKSAGSKNGGGYLILWNDMDFSSSAVNQLAAYRSATVVDVSDVTPAKTILNDYVKYYDPDYLALIGDGDYWETDQFYAPNPVASSHDPNWVPTDFFYEETTMVTFTDSDNNGEIESVTWPDQGTGTWTWSPEYCVGRVMCWNDASLQAYVQLINDYETGNFNFGLWNAYFSYFCGSSCGTWNTHDTLVNAYQPTWHPIYCRDCSEGCDYDFTQTNTYNEFSWGNTLFYFNTHGGPTGIYVSRDDDVMTTSDISSHSLADPPGLMWVDSCQTAALGDQPNSVNYQIYPSGVIDDDTSFAANWLGNNAIGYMGSSCVAYLGDFDAFDEALAQEFGYWGDQTIASSIGWARSRYYASVPSIDNYVKKTILEIVYFGDPALTLQWSEIPELQSPGDGTTVSSPVNFDWSDCEAADDYWILVDDTPWTSPEVDTSTSSSNYTANLSPGTYYWSVRSRNGSGGSHWSPVRSFTVGGGDSITWTHKQITGNPSVSVDPAVAASVNGDVYVVWQDLIDGTDYDIFMKVSHDGMNTWTHKRLTGNTSASESPAVAAYGNDVYVVWTDYMDGDWDIYMKVSHDGMNTWTHKKLTNNTSKSINPAVAASGDDVYVVWSDDTDGDYDIYMMISHDGMNSWTHKRLTNSSGDAKYPAVAASGDDVYVVWSDDTDGPENIFMKASHDGMNSWTHKRLTNNSLDSRNPTVAVEGTNVYVAWKDRTAEKSNICMKVSHDGMNTWTHRQITDYTSAHSADPAIACGMRPNVYLVYTSNVDGDWDIYMKVSHDGMNTWKHYRLTGNTSDSDWPAIAIDYGYVYMFWADDMDGDYDIYMKKIYDVDNF